MNLMKSVVRCVVALSLMSAVGCGVEAEPETTDATEQADSIGDAILCHIVQCDDWSSARWVKLGESPVDGLFEHESFDVDSRLGRFSKLQLRIREGGVKIHDLDIYLRDGSRFSPDFDHNYNEGSRSDIAELPRAQRIESISISASKQIFGTGSVVEFWARR